MANSVNNVTVGKPAIGGCAFRAAAGTTPPTDAVTSLASAFRNMGYISDEGIKKSTERETDEIKAYGGDVVATPQNGFSDKFTMKFLEVLNPDTIKAVHGDTNVSGALATGLTINVNSKELPEGVWVIDQVLRGTVDYRMVIPHGKITEVGEVTYVDGEAVGYEVTVTALPDSSGNTHYEYLKETASGSSGTS